MQVKPLNPLPLSACQVLDGGRLFGMVLELLEGGSLAERIRASVGLGRIVALYHHSATLHQICSHIWRVYF